jgi:hypothetical protein
MGDPTLNIHSETEEDHDKFRKGVAHQSTDKLEDFSSKPREKEPITPIRAYLKLWSFASPLDVLLRVIAAIAAAGAGTAPSLMAIIFGNLVNVLNGNHPRSPEEFRSDISKNALYFVYLFIGKFVVSCHQGEYALTNT